MIVNFYNIYRLFVGNPDYGDRVEKPFSYTTVLQTLFVLPCIATEIWLNNGYEWQWSYIHVAASLIPLSAYLGGKDWKDISQALLVANTVSLGVVSYLAEKYFGVAAAVSFGIDYILISEEGYSISDKIPSQDLFNYGMCFAAYFSLRALCE